MSEEAAGRSTRPDELTERERYVLEAVVRTYVDTAEPAGSRTVARNFDLGVSPATVRNTMADLEEKGYLYHPHTSAGRIPTDDAYRFFVDRLMEPATLEPEVDEQLRAALRAQETPAVERFIRSATRALSLLTRELGVAVAPRMDDAVLEKLELHQVSSGKVLLVATIRSGVIRTVYVDIEARVPSDTLVNVTVLLNERLAGHTLREIRETLRERLRDSVPDDDPAARELLNVFLQSGGELFEWTETDPGDVHLGQTSVLASQPEFTSGERLLGLLELTEQRELLAGVLGSRDHASGLQITIGGEHRTVELSDFTLVTAEYQVGGLRGIIGVIGPTRMPYEKVITIVDHASSLVNEILR